MRFLDALGALPRVKEKACPIEAIRMIDDTGQLLPTPDLTLRASEIDLPALGVNISNDELVEALLEVARERAAFEIVDADIADYVFDGDGRRGSARRRAQDRGGFRRRRRRAPKPGAGDRRDRHAGMDLSASRADDAALA